MLQALQIPSQKEWAAGVGGLLAFAIIAVSRWSGYELGDAIESGLIVLLPALIAKLVPPSQQDVLAHVNDTIAQAGTLVGKLTPASDSTAPMTRAATALADKAT